MSQARTTALAETRTQPRLALARVLCYWFPPVVAARTATLIYPRADAFRDDLAFSMRARTGSMFYGRTSDFHGCSFSIHGYYDWRNWALARVLCPAGSTLIEIGANVGTETVGFRDIVGPTGRVYAFEPLPGNIAALENLVDLNGWKNVHVMPLALGSEDKNLCFAPPPGKHASGVGHVVVGQRAGVGAGIQVKGVRLDTLADQIGPASAIFSDVEGLETGVLRGAVDYIRKHRPGIVLEASPKLLLRAGSSLAELLQTIRSLGYQAHAVGRFGLRPVLDAGAERSCNWLCVPDSQAGVAKRCSLAILACGVLPCVRGINPLCRKNP